MKNKNNYKSLYGLKITLIIGHQFSYRYILFYSYHYAFIEWFSRKWLKTSGKTYVLIFFFRNPTVILIQQIVFILLVYKVN